MKTIDKGKGYVYLLHFDKPYRHARHYLGSTNDLDGRLARHREGNGARLIQVVTEAGIGFSLAKLWVFDTEKEARVFERGMKKRKNTPQFCPLCNREKLV